MAEVALWIALSLIIYTYFGYLLFLYIALLVKKPTVEKGSFFPNISIIITVHNEAAKIRAKIENTLSLDYPVEIREIIVASDGSTDGTNEIVKEYKNEGIILVACLQHKGKEYAQLEAITIAKGEILIFSDVGTILETDALLHMVSNFHDPTVGCVSSEDRVLVDRAKAEQPAGEDLYVRYEMLLRRLESRVHSLVGLSGSFFAVRRALSHDWPIMLPSDFRVAIQAVKQGYRAIAEPASIGTYKAVSSQQQEFERKVRTVMRGIAVLMKYPEIMNPFHYGIFAIQIISHKLFRWLMPLFMACALASNLYLLAQSSFYLYLGISQLMFYSLATSAIRVQSLNQSFLFKLPGFLILVNICIALAWFNYIVGRRIILWRPSNRSDI